MDHTRSFYNVLVNTLIANVTTSFLWFALMFWVYIETRSVLATAIIGGPTCCWSRGRGAVRDVGRPLGARSG